MPATFSRATIVAATELLARLSHGDFNIVALKFGLENTIPSASSMNLTTKAANIARFVLEDPAQVIATPLGAMTRGELFVREAIKKYYPHYPDAADDGVRRALAHDGWTIDVTGTPSLLPMVPQELELPAVDDEVHRLLQVHALSRPLGHLNQAIDAHRQGSWAGANGQLRAFLEALIIDIARQRYAAPPGHNLDACMTVLANSDFLSTTRNEWHSTGKDFMHGLFKRLHPEGAHAGLSDEDDSSFRLHVVLVTARSLLRRLPGASNSHLS